MKPIIPSKFDIGFIITNANQQHIEALEPWCNTIYTDFISTEYIANEDTSYDLQKKFLPLDSEKNNEILVEINGNKFVQDDFTLIQQLPEIIQDSGEENFHGEIGNLVISIIHMNKYENELIKCEY